MTPNGQFHVSNVLAKYGVKKRRTCFSPCGPETCSHGQDDRQEGILSVFFPREQWPCRIVALLFL